MPKLSVYLRGTRKTFQGLCEALLSCTGASLGYELDKGTVKGGRYISEEDKA